jgi:hypothetical protein
MKLTIITWGSKEWQLPLEEITSGRSITMTTKTSGNRNVIGVETQIVEDNIGIHGRTKEDVRIPEGGTLDLPVKSKTGQTSQKFTLLQVGLLGEVNRIRGERLTPSKWKAPTKSMQ